MDVKQIVDNYLSTKFPNLVLRSPLFYNSPIGIRFELGSDLCMSEGRMEQVYYRSLSLFQELYTEENELFIVVFVDSWDNYPISDFEDQVIEIFSSYISESIALDVSREEMDYRYKDPSDDFDKTKTFRYSVCCKVKDVNYKNLLIAIANQEVGIEPTIIGDLYIINTSNNTIFHLYDYRGIDIVANKKETLEKLYSKYYNWILEYDRARIDFIFKSKE
jgi:hypothetical protein